MNCPNCSQPVEDSAAFCGNCGVQLQAKAAVAIHNARSGVVAQVYANHDSASSRQTQGLAMTPLAAGSMGAAAIPGYASLPHEHIGETKALVALILGIVALPASFIPFIGLALGIASLVLGTMSRHSTKRIFSTLGIVFAGLAIVASIAMWAVNIASLNKTNATRNQAAGQVSPALVGTSAETPCYAFGLVQTMNFDHNQVDSCDVRAYNGSTLNTSSEVYKVYGNQIASINGLNFAQTAKQVLEKDVASTLPGFTIQSEGLQQFAGSPAYVIQTQDTDKHVQIAEAAVLHKTGNGYNIFILVHGTTDSGADFKTLEAQWQWK